ncbi:MAG TPA: Hsp20/alpha crystallin family protein [Opitutaceae bacterium]|jgi:HSP20 family protein|nr:Hsp20/alpha crystallin family protein [Opitutaceae bacterium]HRE04076.1 Hsp20/alpha crystallin family protein [Opitutaceae bacterium]
MHTIIPPLKTDSRSRRAGTAIQSGEFRKPHYDCSEHADTLKLEVYVPGVEAAGIEIAARGPDLVITALKSHFVRVNWHALHLEGAQRDYRLVLRIGHGVDYANLEAAIHNGVLTLKLPKKSPQREPLAASALKRVA